MLNLRSAIGMFSTGLAVVSTGPTYSQDYPSKPIHIITGAAGGGSDFVARVIAQGISAPLGQPVVVDNRQNALTGEITAKAPPDGYNLLVGGSSHWIRPQLARLSYDPIKDFVPISLVVREINVIAVHPSLPVKSVKELIAIARARPGELNYGSTSGVGSASHLATELFKQMAGVDIVHIPYKGQAPAITALVSGETQVGIFDVGLMAPHVKSGRLRALAVASAQPSALAPGLPTAAATGLPGYEAVSMTGIFAPAKTPAAIINRLNHEIVRVVNRPDVKERILNAGAEAVGSSPEEFAAKVQSEVSRVSKLIKDAGIHAE